VDINKYNESQYNDNTKSLLVILLLLLLLKCDKTKQKCATISNSLQEENIFKEDTPKTTKDSEIESKHFKEKRIKNNIEKAKIKMLIKELKSGTESSIYLDKVNEQGFEPLEEVNEHGFEPLEEVNEQGFEPLEEVNEQGFKPLEEVNEQSIEPLEEFNEQNIEPLKEVNEQGFEPLEEVNEQNIEPLAEVNEQSIELIEEVQEQSIQPLGEVNEQNIENLEEEKSVQLENENLESTHKKHIRKMKNSVADFSENFIRPMEVILKQLVGENITFSTVARSNKFATNAILLSVKDGIVHIDISNSILSIPISDIVGVESNLIHSIELQSLMETSTKEFYEYKEWALRNLFSTMIGEQVYIETTGSGSFNNISDKIVTNVGQGVVVLDNTMAISLGRIILVERR
jgi:hypothetical protein